MTHDSAGPTADEQLGPFRPLAPVGACAPTARHYHQATTELLDVLEGGDRSAQRQWRSGAVALVHAAVDAARGGLLPLDDETVGRLAFVLGDVLVRDAAASVVPTGTDDAVLALWRDVAMRAPRETGSAPAALLALCRWQLRDYAGARRAAEIAMHLDPSDRLAVLVRDASLEEVDPHGFRPDDAERVRRDPPADRGRRRGTRHRAAG